MLSLGWDLQRNTSVGSEAPSLAKVVLWLQQTIAISLNNANGSNGSNGSNINLTDDHTTGTENRDPRQAGGQGMGQGVGPGHGHGHFVRAKLSHEQSPDRGPKTAVGVQ